MRHRAKFAEVVDSERVLADLARAYDRAYAGGQIAIRAGVKKLLRRWGRDATAHDRWLRQRAAARRKRKKRSLRSRHVIALILMIVVGWLPAKWLLREPVYIEPPPAPLQITIHLHQPPIVLTKAQNARSED